MEGGGVVVQSEGEKILLSQGKKPPYETLNNIEKRVIYLSVASGMFLAGLAILFNVLSCACIDMVCV